MTTTRALTLIELLISITLGLVVVYTAFAAVRVAANAMTASQRLATQNALLRIGVEAAVNEADYWIGSDDPEAGQPKPLRAFDADGGRPFTDFRASGFIDSAAAATPWNDARSGWNSSPLAWSPADPRTWCRGNVAEEHSPRSWWGNFGIYSNIDRTRAWHSWHATQVRGIVDTLGFYGLFDYLPSNGFASYHVTPGGQGKTPRGASTAVSYGGMPLALIANGTWLCPSDGGDNTMKGRIRNTNGSRYYLPGPHQAAAADARRLAKIGYEARSSAGGYSTTEHTHQVLSDFLAISRTSQELMRSGGRLVAPAHWPEVTYRVHRFVERGHPVTLCVVEVTDPLSGAQVALPFTTVATTLRGARQQRRPTSGWADPFSSDPTQRATLDYVDTP